MGNYIELSLFDLALSIMLILIACGISTALRLGLTKSLLIASTRCMLQLGAIGLVLKKIFQINSPILIIAWLFFMLYLASKEAIRRSRASYKGINLDSLATMTISSLVSGVLVTQIIIKVTPWYNPQYLIPIFGMILGNSLNGICLCLDRLFDYVKSHATEIELRLAFGATNSEAISQGAKSAVRTGMIPIINNMTVAGLVSLPGMMTGQIVAGVSPLQAVSYQIIIMFMIAASNAIGSMVIAIFASKRLISNYGVEIIS